MASRSLAIFTCMLGSLVLSLAVVEVPLNYAPPDIPVPTEPACTVPLFSRDFNDTKAHVYDYPDVVKACGDKWAKVIFDLKCGVTPGIQYDRSLFVFLKGVNIYTGTTEEPGQKNEFVWHIQADLSHYGVALLAGAGSGSTELDNVVDKQYTGVPHCKGSLKFYKATEKYPAFEDPATHVVSLGTSYRYADGNNNHGNSSLTSTIASLPKNTVRVELEMTLQNQQDEEFYWSQLQSAWRAALVRIDGTPVGVLSAYPYVFCGGDGPALWQPTPGVQTLRLLHRRLDLTPLVSMLNDGKKHTIQVDVGLAGSNVTTFFYLTGTVLAWADASLAAVTGSVTMNTLEDCMTTSCLKPVIAHGVSTKKLRYTLSGSQTLVPLKAGEAKTRTIKVDYAIDFAGNGEYTNTTSSEISDKKSRTESFNMTFSQGGGGVHQEFRSEQHGYGAPDYSSTIEWTDRATAGENTTAITSFSFSDSAGNKFQRTLSAENGVKNGSTESGSLEWWADPFFGKRAPPTKTVGSLLVI